MNNVVLIGNLARDPDKHTTQSGISQTMFTIAVARRHKNEQGGHDADFIRCVSWRQTADYIAQYGAKGRKVAVSGELQTRSYERNGQTHMVTEVIVSNFEFLQQAQNSEAAPKPEQVTEPVQQGFTEVTDDELPF